MKILYLVPYAPTRIRTRPYNLLISLARAGYNVTLATCWENQQEKKALDFFDSFGIRVIGQPLGRFQRVRNLTRAVLSGMPMQSQYSWQPSLFSLVWEEIQRHSYDVLHVEHLRGAVYGLQLRSRLPKDEKSIPIIWDSVDCISYLFEQAAALGRSAFGRTVTRLELAKTKKFEASMVQNFDRILFTSTVDAQAYAKLEGFEPAHPIVVLPNGVDLGYFSPGSSTRSENIVIFSGKLSYHANITAALHLVQEIMPHVWQSKPDTLVQLAGKDPDWAIRKLAAADARIQVTGTVSDLRPYLCQAALAVAPMLYGAGIQNKVLEAMACGTPLVAYPLAVSGLPGLTPGVEMHLAYNSAEFGSLILRLLADKEESELLSENAYHFISTCYSWEKIGRDLEAVYRDAIDHQNS